MNNINKLVRIFAVGFIAVGLSACGGGGGGSAKKDSGGGDSAGVVGKAIKGPVNAGTVICFNADGSVKETSTTNSDGVYELDTACPLDGELVVRGGIDSATGEEIEELSASGDSKYITPITTLEKVVADNEVVFGSAVKNKNTTFLN